MTTHDNDRAEFERRVAYLLEYPLDYDLETNTYDYPSVQLAWNIWQAARANSGWQAMELVKRCAHYIERSDLRDLDFGLGFEDYADEICLLAKSTKDHPKANDADVVARAEKWIADYKAGYPSASAEYPLISDLLAALASQNQPKVNDNEARESNLDTKLNLDQGLNDAKSEQGNDTNTQLLEAENSKMRKIAAFIPARIYIEAKEKAGFGEYITTKQAIAAAESTLESQNKDSTLYLDPRQDYPLLPKLEKGENGYIEIKYPEGE